MVKMRMFEVKKVQIEEKILLDIICDKCGKSCKTGPMEYDGLLGATAGGGYYSRHMGDMSQYKLDICEKCFVEWINTFKHDPQIKD